MLHDNHGEGGILALMSMTSGLRRAAAPANWCL